jgi:hypothetical protein
MLTSAHLNFSQVAARLGTTQWQGVLMLAEMRAARWFDSVHTGSRVGSWSLEPQAEEASSLCAVAGNKQLLIVAGRQVVTSEGIEVLTLGTRTVIADGQPIAETVAAARDAHALIVLPWGAGKWLGGRGRIVNSTLKGALGTPLFPGDNGGRPLFWPKPDVFASATQSNRPLVSGTDPLPLPGEEMRVGSFGFWINEPIAATTPARALYDRLSSGGAKGVTAFGSLQGPVAFVRNQLALRMRKSH